MRETKDNSGFYQWRPYRVHAPARTPRFRLGLFLVALFLMAGGLYGIVLLLTEILELEGK